MTYVGLFCILILKVLLYSSSADDSACTKSLSICKLPVGDGITTDIPKRGSKGIKGDTGDVGNSGPKGISGDNGPRGSYGPEGISFKGDKGISGVVGPPGLPGPDGFCPCKLGSRNIHYEGPIKNKLCKDTSVGKTGNFTLKIAKKAMKVTCVVRENATVLTCLRNDKSEPKTYPFKNISEGFWLSAKNFKLDDLYGVNRDILTYFQIKSNSAFQTIRYHCYNSNPFPRDNVEKSLLLLTWNDQTIGPMPTLTKPYFYSVTYDGCSNNTKDTWSYTDIKIVSIHPRRVPVTDFYIRDIGNELDQQFKIELIELCYD